MRILHVTPSFYPAWAYGGVTRCAYELCRALAALGHEVTVWTSDVLDAAHRVGQRRAVVDGVAVEYFPNLSNRLAYHLQLYWPLGLARRARGGVGAFDVIHLHAHRHRLNALVAAAARGHRVPYVFSGHGTVPRIERHLLVKRVVDALGARALLRGAVRCIAVSQAEVPHYVEAGVAAARVRVVPNGIRVDDFHRLPARGSFRRTRQLGPGPLVLFVGKITPRKGVDVLIRALALLPPETTLAVVGNFMMPREPLMRLVEELGLAARVCFAGFLSGEEKAAAYVDADVVAYPSVHEIFGLVPLEGWMCGAPVVVCDDSGCAEIVRAAEAGIVVPYGDARALASALQGLLADADRRRELARRGRLFVERNLDWPVIAEKMVAVYREVAADAAFGRTAGGGSKRG